MYLIAFSEPVDGFTHGMVETEVRRARGIHVDVIYGTVVGGEFVASSNEFRGSLFIRGGEEMDDFVAELKKVPDRPADAPDHRFWSDDLRAYLGTPKAERKARIEARKA